MLQQNGEPLVSMAFQENGNFPFVSSFIRQGQKCVLLWDEYTEKRKRWREGGGREEKRNGEGKRDRGKEKVKEKEEEKILKITWINLGNVMLSQRNQRPHDI